MNKKIFICGVLMLGITLCGAGNARPPETVAAGFAKQVDAVVNRRYVGVLKGVLDVGLVPRISGVIKKQLFKDGDFVKAGQLLFEIEDTSYRAKFESAKARFAQCKSEYAFAKRNLERISTLWKQKAVSESSYDEAVRLESSSAAAVDAARAELLDAENNFSYTKIYSPINGRAGKAVLSEQNYVTPSTGTILSVVSLDPIYVEFSISSRDYYEMFGSFEALQKYADVRIELADGSRYSEAAKVIFLDNRVDRDTDSIRVRATLVNKEHKLIPDGLVTVRVARISDKSSVGIPPAAMINDGKNNFVYVLDSKNRVIRREVIPGELNGGVQIIAAGLKAGEKIVVDGTHKAMPGAIVNAVIVEENK